MSGRVPKLDDLDQIMLLAGLNAVAERLVADLDGRPPVCPFCHHVLWSLTRSPIDPALHGARCPWSRWRPLRAWLLCGGEAEEPAPAGAGAAAAPERSDG